MHLSQAPFPAIGHIDPPLRHEFRHSCRGRLIVQQIGGHIETDAAGADDRHPAANLFFAGDDLRIGRNIASFCAFKSRSAEVSPRC